MYKFPICLLALVAFFSACSENLVDNPNPNQPPETFISVFTENDLNPTISRQTINWWGDDPDGIVVGFIYTFDANAADVTEWSESNPVAGWTFTTERQETFVLTLSGTDTTFALRVKAVDDEGAADPTAATQDYAIVNSRPSVEFVLQTDVPETTFTVANFTWRGSDLDGDDTIAKFQYVLDDTTNESAWTDLDPKSNSITLNAAHGLTEGEHAFYLRAFDIAGAVSQIVRMPRSENDVWFVKEPKSKFLLLDDYNIADNTDAFYQEALGELVGDFDAWDIKSNGGALEPVSTQAFTQTLLLFDRILWYADTDPNLGKAQVSVIEFLEAGGKLIMTTGFKEFSSNQGDPLAFSPVDSLGTKISRLTRNQIINPAEGFAEQGYPELQISAAIIPNVFPVVPKLSSVPFYRLPEGTTRWTGQPAVGVIDGKNTFVFFGLPLAALDAQGTVEEILGRILTEIF